MAQKQHYYKVFCRGYNYQGSEDVPGTCRADSAEQAASYYDNVYHVMRLLTPNERKDLRTDVEE